MAVYYGVVKGNVIVLPDDVNLHDGETVEVRRLDEAEEERLEDLFQQELLRRGLLSEIKPRRRPLPPGDRTPIEIEGPPLSQTIIEERR